MEIIWFKIRKNLCNFLSNFLTLDQISNKNWSVLVAKISADFFFLSTYFVMAKDFPHFLTNNKFQVNEIFTR